jgi:hypothetical protein
LKPAAEVASIAGASEISAKKVPIEPISSFGAVLAHASGPQAAVGGTKGEIAPNILLVSEKSDGTYGSAKDGFTHPPVYRNLTLPRPKIFKVLEPES